MAKVVVIGAGFAGHTAAMYLGDSLGKEHDVTMINMSDRFAYVPSWVWVGVGRMDVEKTRFPLKPVYDRMNVNFIQRKAVEIHPDEQYVVAEHRDGSGGRVQVDYDYLVIATGPKLDFDATPGLGPDNETSYSICTAAHAVQARDKYLESVERMKRGERQKIVIGTGHGTATCEGAAFEYVTNIHKDLVRRGVRNKADITYLTNEPELGDFGVRGVQVKKGGKLLSSEAFIKAVFKEYDTNALAQRATVGIDKERIYWQDIKGIEGDLDYDYSVLIPKFSGMPMKYIGKDGEDVSDKLTNAGGFITVDAIYGLDYDTLAETPEAWPAVYQNRTYRNIFAAGIAFAPPGPISRPGKNPKGTPISPAPPRTGMVSGIIGRLVAKNIIDLVQSGRMTHSERMSEMAAACIASMGDSLWDGSAAVIVVYPVVPDQRRYPNEAGRDMFVTDMEMGLAGAWMKRMIHTTFMHKLQGRIGWKLIPE
jgi:sulfide:quinone oxidoreductase